MGAPMKEVTMPTGRAPEPISARPTVSAPNSSKAPMMAENGISRPWSAPTSRLAMCGAMSPTKAMTP
jgi:hypothetical protein